MNESTLRWLRELNSDRPCGAPVYYPPLCGPLAPSIKDDKDCTARTTCMHPIWVSFAHLKYTPKDLAIRKVDEFQIC